jgi:hypothetical protein
LIDTGAGDGKLMMQPPKILKKIFLSAKEVSYRQGQRICIEEFVSDPKASSVYRRYQPAMNHASKYMTDDFLHVVQMYLF